MRHWSGTGEHSPGVRSLWARTTQIRYPLSTVWQIFAYQGKYDEALKWYRRALAGEEKFLGKGHPNTLSTIHSMAGVLSSQEKYDEVLEWHRQALAGREKSLGMGHPNTLSTVHCTRRSNKYSATRDFAWRQEISAPGAGGQ